MVHRGFPRGCHVSNRKDAVFYPGHGVSDYVFLDESEIKGADLEGHNKSIQQGKLVLVARRDKMALFKSTEKKASAAGAASASVAPPASAKPVVTPPVGSPPTPPSVAPVLGSAIAPALPVRAPLAPPALDAAVPAPARP